MAYVTFAERHGIELGLAQGRTEGTVGGLLTGIGAFLAFRFGDAGSALMPLLREIDDPARLEAILDTIKTAATLDEVRAFAEQGE